LIKPILEGSADVVVGERPIEATESFSPTKKFLQRFGSKLVSRWFKTSVPDIASGFRAYSREAALCIDLDSKFTGTIETIVKLSEHNFYITTVPISTNTVSRPSRLLKSTTQYIFKQASIILRLYLEYKPLSFFGVFAGLFGLVGSLFWIRFLLFFFAGDGSGHVQSLIAGSLLLTLCAASLLIGLLAHLSANNRRKLEKCLMEMKRLRYTDKYSE
jgi:hypothetical protein